MKTKNETFLFGLIACVFILGAGVGIALGEKNVCSEASQFSNDIKLQRCQ